MSTGGYSTTSDHQDVHWRHGLGKGKHEEIWVGQKYWTPHALWGSLLLKFIPIILLCHFSLQDVQHFKIAESAKVMGQMLSNTF